MEQKNNSKVFLRPRFSLEVGKSKEEAISAIERELVYLKKDYKYKISDHHIFIDVSEKDSHFWSPHLHIEIVTNDQTSSTIKGLFSPKPQVWTFFMFLHFVIGPFEWLWRLATDLHPPALRVTPGQGLNP